MAYETGTASNIADLMDKLQIFAVANGWTKNEPAGSIVDRLSINRNSVYVQFRWATTSPTAVAVYQSLGFSGTGTNPGGHTSDSGQGLAPATAATDANIRTARHVLIPNSSMSYWFFESDYYIHVVITRAALQYSHFGFGELVKQGTWTGGEYAYGQVFATATQNIQLATSSSFLLDGQLGSGGLSDATTYRPFAATVHVESLPAQAASTKWALCWGDAGNPTNNAGTDRASLQRYNVLGGFRSGPIASSFARMTLSATSGLTSMYPIALFYFGGVVGGIGQWYPLGYMADVRGIDTQVFSETQEITVGADTWVVFPVTHKFATQANGNCRSMGVAYKKVTT